jgi:AraC family transcriptional regulator
MSERAARDVVDLMTVPVPVGRTDTPLMDRHVLDIHLGHTVQTAVRLDGRERRGPQRHGSFCIVPAGVTGTWRFERPSSALLVRLAPELVADTAEAMGLRGVALAPAVHEQDAQVERLGWLIQAAEDDAGGQLMRDSLAAAIAARLLGRQARRAPEIRVAALPAWRLARVRDYIEAHLADDLTLAELAGVAGFSLSHFKALFRQAMGVPVHRYVLERRVERARLMVLEGRRTMTEIAVEVGFAHASHLARSMRRVLGRRPAELR